MQHMEPIAEQAAAATTTVTANMTQSCGYPCTFDEASFIAAGGDMDEVCATATGFASNGDVAFMIFCTTLVMLQTPAMGIAQAGMIRRKNALSMIMQTLTGLVIGSLLFFVVGYSLVYGRTVGGVIGTLDNVFLIGVPQAGCLPGTTIPGLLFVAFQMMFALMAPVIVTGAWAEKMRFPAFLVFVSAWPFLVYYPLAHWVWNDDGWLAALGVIDFAGGITIHTAAGVAAFAVTYVLQTRHRAEAMGEESAHNLPLSLLGGALIWAGWYSFNGGSALAASSQASTALMNTHMAACAAAAVWVLLAYRRDARWHVSEIIGGALAGLAAITPGSGYVQPWAACVIGLLGGVTSFYAHRFIRERLGLDDVLDVMSLQGAPGITGSVLVGVFATTDVGGVDDGVLYGGGRLLWLQLLGVGVAVVWSMGATFVLMYAMKRWVGIDVSADVEELGLDLTQIGEQAYDTKLDAVLDLGEEAIAAKVLDRARAGDESALRMLASQGVAVDSMTDSDGRHAMHLAAAHGHLHVLCFFVRRFGSAAILDVEDKHGNTPLSEAVQAGHTECVAWLAEHGCALTSPEHVENFFEAVSEGDFALTALMLQAGVGVDVRDYDKRTAAMVASSEGHTAILRSLLQAGANVELRDRWGNSALECARSFHRTACVRLLLDGLGGSVNGDDGSGGGGETGEGMMLLSTGASINSDDNQSAPAATTVAEVSAATRRMCAAAEADDIVEMRRLIEKGADPSCGDYDGRTPLHVAMSQGSVELVEFLLSQPLVNVNAVDRWRRTPLHYAEDHGRVQLALVLRHAGAIQVNKKIGQRLCKMAAADEWEELEKLASCGIDINICDYDARSAMHLAASEGNMRTAQTLLALGANALAHDRYGYTPIDDAVKHNNHRIAIMLREAVGTSRRTRRRGAIARPLESPPPAGLLV